MGDAHVGRSVYPVTSDGVNVRERDFEQSFGDAVDLVIASEPDVVVFLGDIFDFPRPSYRSFRVVQRGFFKLSEAGLPVVAISGNHDTPRLAGTESPYAALHDVFPDFGLIYRLRHEYFDIGELRVHGIPQTLSEQDALAALGEASKNHSTDRFNLVITHPRVRQVHPAYADINEIEVDAEHIKGDFALLGHYHIHTRVKEGMWYVGSTDTFSFADNPEISKGIGLLDTTSMTFTHKPLEGRRGLVDLGQFNAIGMGPKDIEGLVTENLSSASRDSIARIRLEGVDPGAYRLLDPRIIREASEHLLYFRLEPGYLSSAIEAELPELDSMPSKWMRFVDIQDLADEEKTAVSARGIEYINKAIESS